MGLERGQRAFSQEATEVAWGRGSTKGDTHSSQDLAHNKCQKIRAALIRATNTWREHHLCAFTVPRAEAGGMSAEDAPTWWGLRQVHKQARAPTPNFQALGGPHLQSGHSLGRVSRRPALLRHWRLLLVTPAAEERQRETRLCQQAWPKEALLREERGYVLTYTLT